MKIFKVIRAFLKLRKIKLKKDEICLICPAGIGDTYFTCSLINEIKKKYKTNISVLIKKEHLAIAMAFKKDIKSIFFFDSESIKFTKLFSLKFSPSKFFYSHPGMLFFPRKLRILGYKINLLDLYKLLFNLDKDSELTKPNFKKINIANKNKRQVFLAPESSTANEISADLWFNLYKLFNELGYEVLINSNKAKFNFNKKAKFYNLEELPAILENCKYFISSRSGICDWIAETKVNKIIIYNNHVWYDGTIFDGSSFNMMGFGKNISEIIFKNKSLTIKKIKEVINK